RGSRRTRRQPATRTRRRLWPRSSSPCRRSEPRLRRSRPRCPVARPVGDRCGRWAIPPVPLQGPSGALQWRAQAGDVCLGEDRLTHMSESQTEFGPRIGDQVFEAMQASILNGDYRSGQRLRIRQLAAELGTSVMPVRESLARLEEVGLVETSPHRGAVVKTFTAEELL